MRGRWMTASTKTAKLEPSVVRPRYRPRVRRRSRPLQVVLDVVGLGFGVATFAQVASPDVLLHCLWIVLVLEAFAFGFRTAIVRLLIAFGIVVTYAILAGGGGAFGLAFVELDLSEWPLMMVIALLVAVMAEGVIVDGEQSNQRLLIGQQDERRRIALDLHDGVGQTLTALTITLDSLMTTIDQGPSEAVSAEAAEKARRAREMASVALEETRDVATRLRPTRLAEIGLAAAVEELVSRTAIPVDIAIAPELRRPGILPQETEAEVLRIIQEALGNSIRHARAEHRWVRLEAPAPDRLVAIVGDDGVGFDVGRSRGEGLGMHGMMERAMAVGGHLDIASHRGHGSTIRLELRRPRLAGRRTTDATTRAGVLP